MSWAKVSYVPEYTKGHNCQRDVICGNSYSFGKAIRLIGIDFS
ncbi:Uncharacterized protein XB15_00782 [Leptospira santarosai]|nr:Uncharacterized protein XB15_00782 [Leptospira santarosai]